MGGPKYNPYAPAPMQDRAALNALLVAIDAKIIECANERMLTSRFRIEITDVVAKWWRETYEQQKPTPTISETQAKALFALAAQQIRQTTTLKPPTCSGCNHPFTDHHDIVGCVGDHWKCECLEKEKAS